MRKSAIIILLSGVAATVAGGCSSDNKPASSQTLTAKDADKLSAQRATFSHVQDPPLTADTHFATAQLAEMQGAPDAAETQYLAALKIDPKHLPSLYRLGMMYTHEKKFPEAENLWTRYLRATNYSASGYNNLAFCYDQAGDYKRAEETYQDGLQKDAKNVQLRVNYGVMLARLDQTDAAIEAWKPVLTEAEIHYNLASVYESKGRKTDARAEYQKALAVDPKMNDAKVRLAKLD